MTGKNRAKIFVLVSVSLAILAIVGSAQAGKIDNSRQGTVVINGTGLMWVADAHYPVTSGWSKSSLMPQARALEFVRSMNAREVENFGHQDWRLANIAELRLMSKVSQGSKRKGGLGDMRLLGRYLAAKGAEEISANGDAVESDHVYAWPIRSQGSGSDGVVILATNSLHLKKDSTITGGVVANNANDASVRPTLVAGVEAQIDSNVTIIGDLKADSIGNEPGASASSTSCNEVQGAGSLSCENLPDPLTFPVVGLPTFQATESDTSAAADVSVGNNSSTTLAAGTYRDITIGKNGSVCFSGGVYDIRSISGSDSGISLVFQDASEVRLDENLLLGSSPFVGADDGTFGCDAPPAGAVAPAASEVVFFIAESATFGAGKNSPRASIDANIYAVGGKVEIGKQTDATGAFIGQDFLMDRDSTVVRDSAFAFAEIPTEPTADPQDVFTDGDTNLVIILTGSDPKNENLSFSITNFPNAAIGSIISGPTAIQDPALTFCSVTRTQACTVDADCPASETCSIVVLPPISSAAVTYDPVDASNSSNSFTFKVTNESAQEASADVEINPGGDATPDPPAIGTVEAVDKSAETTVGNAVTIRLRGKAPCTTFDVDPESATFGQCLVGVSLTFAIEADCGDPGTDPGDCASPSNGSLSGLTPESAAVVRTATVVYTPTGPAGTADSFEFEACGTISGDEVCDKATVSVATEAAATLAQNLSVSIQSNQEVDIPLVGNPGGAGGAAPTAAPSDSMSRVGGMGSVKTPLRAQSSGGGRLVYIGTDPSSDQHINAAEFGTGFCSITTTTSCTNDNGCPVGERCTGFDGLPNSPSRLSANAATWAGKSDDPAIACVEGDPIFFGSHVEDLLNSEGLSCASVIAAADLDTADLSTFDVLYTGATRDNVPDLVAAATNVQNFVDGGGGLVVETNIVDSNSWTWVPFASAIGHSGPANLGGMDTSIVASDHPVMDGLDDGLSDWGISVHTTFEDAQEAGFTVLAVGEDANGSQNFEPYIISFDPDAELLIFSITSLPQFGTLKDSSGTPITSVPTILPDGMVTYTNTAPAAMDSFNYQVAEGAVISTAIVGLLIDDSCAEQGRPPGCSPGS